MICSSLVKSYILKSLMYFLIMFNEELIPFQKKKKMVCCAHKEGIQYGG
jgi:hypothetical protein